MSIVVHIDEIILHGTAPGDRGRIAAALMAELERLIATHGLPPGLFASNGSAALDAGAFAVPAGARPEIVGTQIARSVYGCADRGQRSKISDQILTSSPRSPAIARRAP